MLHPGTFSHAHPVHRRGAFAVNYGLDLDNFRQEANDHVMPAEQDVDPRPALGTFCSANLHRDAEIKPKLLSTLSYCHEKHYRRPVQAADFALST